MSPIRSISPAPFIRLLEVFKKIAQQRSEGFALQYVAVMQQGRVVGFDI